MKTKNNFKKVIIFFIAICIGISCSKDSLEEEKFYGTMSLKLNGNLITFDEASGYGFFDLETGTWQPFHLVQGTTYNNKHSITMRFPASELGVHKITSLIFDGYVNNDTDENYATVSWSSQDGEHHLGTFNFTAYSYSGDEVIVVTDGQYEINKQQ